MSYGRIIDGCSPKGAIRVLHVIPGEDRRNNLIFAQRQVASLRHAGAEVEKFFLGNRTSPLRVIQECLRLRRKVQDFRPHVIHAQYGTVTAMLCALATASPLIVTFHGSDLNPVPSANPIRTILGRFFSQIAALRASHIICVTRQLRDRLWWRRNRVSIIACGVNLEMFRPRPKQEARQELGWSSNVPVVLFNTGKEPTVKRLDVAETAVEIVKKMFGDLRFEVLRGEVDPDRIAVYMNGADCLLVTSDYEGSPSVVKEAMACNLPVVSVDVGDIRERLESVEPSRIVDHDPQKLGSAVTEILELKRRSNGRERIQELSEERVADRVLEIYQQVLGRALPCSAIEHAAPGNAR
jgi:teichuronic acid biosynthesis glycosyltransferase TuaC